MDEKNIYTNWFSGSEQKKCTEDCNCKHERFKQNHPSVKKRPAPEVLDLTVGTTDEEIRLFLMSGKFNVTRDGNYGSLIKVSVVQDQINAFPGDSLILYADKVVVVPRTGADRG